MLKTRDQSGFLTLKSAYILIFIVGLFAHWPVFLSDSIMWDDWLVLAWIGLGWLGIAWVGFAWVGLSLLGWVC